MVILTQQKINNFQQKLLEWFSVEGRTFPWRNSSANNYQRIISEVILQRTKAETASKFFRKFINKYPSWNKLALASEAELKQDFMPIGLHNQRGFRVFKLAQEMNKRKGVFPSTRAEVEEIPMMGQYITNAYELFILKKPSPLLDVNMARVLERYFGPRSMADIRYDPYLQALAKMIVDHHDTIKINWAILDLGAMICKKRKPLCLSCPINLTCAFYNKII